MPPRCAWDWNWDFADAFPGPMGVGAVRLYVFDSATRALVLEKGEVSGPEGFPAGYAMPVEELPEGVYDFVAWCGPAMEEGAGGAFEGGSAPAALDYGAEAWRLSAGVTGDPVSGPRLPALYYGRLERVEVTGGEGVHTVTIPLMKDTNEFTFLLQHLDGPLDPADFDVEIRDDGRSLLWDNGLPSGGPGFSYRPWRVFSGGAEVEGAETSPGTPERNFMVAKVSTSRLVLRDDPADEPRLVITNRKTGVEVFGVPLLRLLLLPEQHRERLDAHGVLHPVGDQEYLDRVGEWTMQFLLDDDGGGGWYALELHILGWHVIYGQGQLK